MVKKFRIRAWGHHVHPELDYESDIMDEFVRQNYPCISVALQWAIPASLVRAEVNHEDSD